MEVWKKETWSEFALFRFVASESRVVTAADRVPLIPGFSEASQEIVPQGL